MQNRLTDTEEKKNLQLTKGRGMGKGRIRGMGLTDINNYT